MLAIILVVWGLENPSTEQNEMQAPSIGVATSKLGRIDFFGAILTSSAIATFLLAVDLPGQGKSWTSPLVISLIAASFVLGITFFIFEARYAREPIFPPRLLMQRDVATSYSILSLQIAAQLAVCASRGPNATQI